MMTEQPPKDSPPLASSDVGPVQMDGAAAAQNRSLHPWWEPSRPSASAPPRCRDAHALTFFSGTCIEEGDPANDIPLLERRDQDGFSDVVL